ncbi:DUF4416 family protein [candidate division FCPU426 bacterium]|nr:DUF4416 family protein [candidate division FCPU426 bacterium]
MGEIQVVPPVCPVAGLLVSSPALFAQAQQALCGLLGAVQAASPVMAFIHTQYYAEEMGAQLWRQFLVFERLHPAEQLVEWKCASNRWERELGFNGQGGRRVNIDPGYLAPGKLVLASTKDHEHRLYLGRGIYAEVTLRVRNKRFYAWEWTYPDYAEATAFFESGYREYLKKLAGAKPETA